LRRKPQAAILQPDKTALAVLSKTRIKNFLPLLDRRSRIGYAFILEKNKTGETYGNKEK